MLVNMILYSEKVWRGEMFGKFTFLSIWQKKVWRMNGSAKGLLMVTTDMDGFSLANCRRFTKFAKLFCYTVPNQLPMTVACSWFLETVFVFTDNILTLYEQLNIFYCFQ